MGGFDTLLEAHVGTFGRLQILYLLYLMAPGILFASNIMEIIFATRPPVFRCSIQDGNSESSLQNLSNPLLSHPLTNSTGAEDMVAAQNPCFISMRGNMSGSILPNMNITQETIQINLTHSAPLPSTPASLSDKPINGPALQENNKNAKKAAEPKRCTKWDYDEMYSDQTLVSTFGLVCIRSWLVGLTKSVQLQGQLIGAMFGGALADRFGRRPVALVAFLVSVVSRVAMALSPVLEMYLVTRLLSGAADLLYICATYVLITEGISPRWRGLPVALYAGGYAIGCMISSLVGYLIPKWSYMALTNTAATTLICLPIFLLPESPRWLYCVGRVDEGKKSLQWMARVSGYKIPQEISYCINMESEKEKGPGILYYIRSSFVRWRLLICVLLWFTVSMLYFGLALNIGGLAGNIYINAMIMGVIDLPGCLFIQPIVNSRLGRRGIISITFAICSATLLADMGFPRASIVRTVLAVVGKCALLFVFNGLYIITPELFPTGMRGASLGVSSGMARLGSAISPFIAQCPGNAPAIIFGGAAIFATVAVLALPETRGKPLPTSVSDMQRQKSLLCGCAGK